MKMTTQMIVLHFKVDRTKSREEMVTSLGRKSYVKAEILATMPIDGPEEGDLFFFCLESSTPTSEIPLRLAEHGLIPDYYAQMQVNADDSTFADTHANAMQWGDGNFMLFDRCGGPSEVSVDRNNNNWEDGVWFAGRPQL